MTQSHLPGTGRGVVEAVTGFGEKEPPDQACLFKERAGFFAFSSSAWRILFPDEQQHTSGNGGILFMQQSLRDVPKDADVISQIIEKTLTSGMLVEVYLVKYPRQYEAALFVDGHYKPGPPVPRPLENASEAVAYWMGVRPKVGLSQEEGDEILGAVNVQNMLHHCYFKDTWGVIED